MHRLGHSTMQAALRYQHSTDRRARQIADAMDRHITSQEERRDEDDDGNSGVLVPVG
jgi:hypothetical protein